MNIQTLHPAPAQTASERYYPAPEVQSNAKNAVTGVHEAPGITAVQGKTGGAGENGIRGELMDRYAPEEPAVRAGLYRKVKDQDGNPTLRFDDPNKTAQEAEETDGEKAPTPAEQAAEEEKAAEERKAAEEKEEKKAETKTTTINTDRVDREIEELKEETKDIAQQLRTAVGERAEELEQKLLLDKIELRLKDNDTYRRAHSQVSVE